MKIGKALGGTVKKVKGKKKVDKLWTFVQKRYEDGLEARRPFERKWILNLAFLMGKQYAFFNRSSHLLQQLRRKPGVIRSIDNQLLWRWNREVADLIKNNPVMSVVPSSNDDEDIKAAKTGDKVLRAFWQSGKMKKKVRQLAGWIFSCGNGFLDDRWNPRLGPTEATPEGEVVYSGDADCGVWSPFDVIFPYYTPGDVELHTFPWIIKAKYRMLDWIKMNHPKEGGRVAAEAVTASQVTLRGILSHFGGSSLKGDGAVVINFYLQPNSDYPKGLFVVAANGIVLEQNDYPFTHYHLEQFKDIDVPGVFWGKSKLEDAIGLQKTWNRTISSIDEFNRMIAKGKFLSPRGSRMEVAPDDTHGEIIEYTPVLGHKPDYMDIKGLPQSLLWSLETTQQSLKDLFNQHEPTMGTNRSDLRSGEMAQFLREQDAHGMIPTHIIFEESLEAVMARVLRRIQRGYTGERMLKIRGESGDFEVFAFKGADLRNNTDVSVQSESSMPDSRAGREQIILKRLQEGLYGNPEDPKVRRQVLQMVDAATVKDVFSGERLDEVYAEWENQMLFKGVETYLINQYDNHAIHLESLNRFRKSMEYQKIKVEDPKKFAATELRFTKHAEIHQKFLDEIMRAQAEQMAMMEGRGGK